MKNSLQTFCPSTKLVRQTTLLLPDEYKDCEDDDRDDGDDNDDDNGENMHFNLPHCLLSMALFFNR